ncbi:MAG: ribonuclease HI family protein [Armatimonadetes bacterium]|nr:ribonuclease HI family protein [Armatimonadota bacterium]
MWGDSTYRTLIAYTDGASQGNPGPAGIGVIIVHPDGAVIKELSEAIGQTTNNVAEYTALIRALEEALLLGCTDILIFSDSELLVNQIAGTYKVRQPHLYPLYQKVQMLRAKFQRAQLTYLPRESNREADALSKRAAAGNLGGKDSIPP